MNSMVIAAAVSIVIALVALLALLTGVELIPFGWVPFPSGDELIIAAKLAAIALAAALYAWLRERPRRTLSRVALIVAAVVFVLSAGCVGLLFLVYRNC